MKNLSTNSTAPNNDTKKNCTCSSNKTVIFPPPNSTDSDPCVDEDDKPDKKDNKTEGDHDGTNACIDDKKSTNAVGKLGENKRIAVTKSPFAVESCDQVILVEGETFIDPKNYISRKKQFFTLSAYMLNSLDKKDPSTINNSILLENLTKVPDLIMGAPSCLNFESSTHKNLIIVCLSNKSAAKDFKQSLMKLIKCRTGTAISDKKDDSGNDKNESKNESSNQNMNTNTNSTSTSAVEFDKESVNTSYDDLFKKYGNEQMNSSNEHRFNLKQWRGVNPAFGLKVPGSR